MNVLAYQSTTRSNRKIKGRQHKNIGILENGQGETILPKETRKDIIHRLCRKGVWLMFEEGNRIAVASTNF